MARDPRVDAYIDRAGEFARPILRHLRNIIHESCPDVREELKWGFPHFMYKGILCSMASFKSHCAFGFWKSKLIMDKTARAEEAMGQFGKIQKVSDLPGKAVLSKYIKMAAKLNDDGVKLPKPRPKPRTELVIAGDFLSKVRKSPKSKSIFEGFSYSHKKQYIEWIGEAKTAETRERRMRESLEWISAGKPRFWKYAKK